MFGILKSNTENQSIEDTLVDEKENKGLVFILILVALGISGIIVYACQVLTTENSFIYMTAGTLLFVAGAIFTSSSLVGFLFGIPRTAVIDESEKSRSRYIGNDNLLQVSDWITKIILGLGLTQIHHIPTLLIEVARFIQVNSAVSNQAFIILIILYFACLGFLFGYLWTRLYFIKMLRDSDIDVNGQEISGAIVTRKIKANFTDMTTEEKLVLQTEDAKTDLSKTDDTKAKNQSPEAEKGTAE